MVASWPKTDEYNKNLFVLGAGSNVLFKDDLFDGAVIKLSKNFSRISLLNENTIIARSGVLDKLLSDKYKLQIINLDLQNSETLDISISDESAAVEDVPLGQGTIKTIL